MNFGILKTPDGQAGIFFAAFGALVAALAFQYPLGTPRQMGPGFFPLALGLLLLVVGIAVTIHSVRAVAAAGAEGAGGTVTLDMRAALAVTVAVLVAGATLLTLGLLVAVPALVIVSAFASRDIRWPGVIATAVVLTAMAWLVFIEGVGLRIPLLWS